MTLPRRLGYRLDETFMELTLEDVKENIEALAASRAKAPKPRVTMIQMPGRRLVIEVRAE